MKELKSDRDKLNKNTLTLLQDYNSEIVDWHFEDNETVLVYDGNDRIVDSFTVDQFEEKFCPDCLGYKGIIK